MNRQDGAADMNHDSEAASGIDFSAVFVVAKSPINRIVLAKIVERSGLRPIVETPETATLHSPVPGAIILDGGVDNKECERLHSIVAAARIAASGAHPVVILLSNRIGTPQSLGLPDIVDAVVAKPITQEKLQPVLERLIAMARL